MKFSVGEIMTFADKLNEYMKAFNCSPKRLVALSGVSAATVSRYRAGTREPSARSDIFDGIVNGLLRAAKEAQQTDVSAEQIRAELLAVLRDDSGLYDPGSLLISLDMLITKLHLNSGEIAAFLGMDQSRFFRIRTGQSRPPEIHNFCNQIGAENFLRELDRFDGKDYISAFDESAFSFSNEAEKKFFAAVEHADNKKSAIICTDLYSGSTEDDGTLKSLEHIIAVLVRKGIHIDFVLNSDNPMDEILPGLKALMPVFMSGNISAYYLKGRRDGIYRYRLISLGNAALTCEAVTGHYDTAITRVASSDEEIRFYRMRAEQILSMACPLIEILDDSKSRMSVLASCSKKQGTRIFVLSTPPFFTLNNRLLDKILERNGVGNEEAGRIKQYLHDERVRTLQILRHSRFIINYPDIPRESYSKKPVFLSVSGLFVNREILCTYEEYAEHVRLMRKFEAEHTNFSCVADKNSPFRNIQIFMHSGQWVMLSKNKTPTIHLYINHSKLRQALENILSPYGENV